MAWEIVSELHTNISGNFLVVVNCREEKRQMASQHLSTAFVSFKMDWAQNELTLLTTERDNAGNTRLQDIIPVHQTYSYNLSQDSVSVVIVEVARIWLD